MKLDASWGRPALVQVVQSRARFPPLPPMFILGWRSSIVCPNTHPSAPRTCGGSENVMCHVIKIPATLILQVGALAHQPPFALPTRELISNCESPRASANKAAKRHRITTSASPCTILALWWKFCTIFETFQQTAKMPPGKYMRINGWRKPIAVCRCDANAVEAQLRERVF